MLGIGFFPLLFQVCYCFGQRNYSQFWVFLRGKSETTAYEVFFSSRRHLTWQFLKYPWRLLCAGCFYFVLKNHIWTEKFGLSDILSGLYSGDVLPNIFPDTNCTEMLRGFQRLFDTDYTYSCASTAFFRIYYN